MMRSAALVGLVLSLAGCGNDPDRFDLANLGRVLGEDAPAVQATPEQMAKAAITQLKEPVMLAVIEATGQTALLVPFGENGAVQTWTTIDRQTISLNAGRIVATRGLGGDLMSLQSSGGARRLVTLNADNTQRVAQFVCRSTRRESVPLSLTSGERMMAIRLEEDCQGETAAFQSVFWVSGADIRMSRQWLGETVGYVTLEVLRPRRKN